jgi:hypothetical protein
LHYIGYRHFLNEGKIIKLKLRFLYDIGEKNAKEKIYLQESVKPRITGAQYFRAKFSFIEEIKTAARGRSMH